MLDNVLTVSVLRTWRDAGGTRSWAETVTVDLSDPSDTKLRGLVSLLERTLTTAKGHDRT